MSDFHFKFIPYLEFFKAVMSDAYIEYMANYNQNKISLVNTDPVQSALIRDILRGYVIETETKVQPTGNLELDELILPGLLNDHINANYPIEASNFCLVYSHYEFNLQDNLIHIWYQDPDNELMDTNHLLNELEKRGLDWMVYDHRIMNDSVAQKLGYDKIELIPRLFYVGVLDPDQNTEIQLDLSRILPPPL